MKLLILIFLAAVGSLNKASAQERDQVRRRQDGVHALSLRGRKPQSMRSPFNSLVRRGACMGKACSPPQSRRGQRGPEQAGSSQSQASGSSRRSSDSSDRNTAVDKHLSWPKPMTSRRTQPGSPSLRTPRTSSDKLTPTSKDDRDAWLTSQPEPSQPKTYKGNSQELLPISPKPNLGAWPPIQPNAFQTRFRRLDSPRELMPSSRSDRNAAQNSPGPTHVPTPEVMSDLSGFRKAKRSLPYSLERRGSCFGKNCDKSSTTSNSSGSIRSLSPLRTSTPSSKSRIGSAQVRPQSSPDSPALRGSGKSTPATSSTPISISNLRSPFGSPQLQSQRVSRSPAPLRNGAFTSARSSPGRERIPDVRSHPISANTWSRSSGSLPTSPQSFTRISGGASSPLGRSPPLSIKSTSGNYESQGRHPSNFIKISGGASPPTSRHDQSLSVLSSIHNSGDWDGRPPSPAKISGAGSPAPSSAGFSINSHSSVRNRMAPQLSPGGFFSENNRSPSLSRISGAGSGVPSSISLSLTPFSSPPSSPTGRLSRTSSDGSSSSYRPAFARAPPGPMIPFAQAPLSATSRTSSTQSFTR